MAVASAVIILVAGTVVGLNLTVFSGRGKIDVTQIQAEELSAWILAGTDTKQEELVSRLSESATQVCPQITVHTEVFDAKEYENKLAQALEQGSLPDVFCADGVSWETCKEQCVELSSLLRTMQLEEYLYLDGMQKGEAYLLPTAVQIGVAYLSEEKEKTVPESVDIRQLAEQGAAVGFADEGNTDVFSRFQNLEDPLGWIVGDLSNLGQVEAVTVEAVPSTDFAAAPVTKDGKLIGNLKNCYAVKKSESENRQKAGMVLLSLLLSEGMQSAAYMDNEDGLPLNRSVLESYQENKLTTYLNFLQDYNLEEVEFYEGDCIAREIRKEVQEGESQ